MTRTHRYELTVTWTGNQGSGTSGYGRYARTHEVTAPGKAAIAGSSDPAFRGDPQRWNPEELLVASLSQCHMLWYLSLCAGAGIIVTAYADHPYGSMVESPDGGGRFVEVVLRPEVLVVGGTDVHRAHALHQQAHEKCFIANSVNFPVRHEPTIAIDPVAA